MAVTLYRNTDASAPVVTGQGVTGGIVALLKACLVDGYGSKSAAGWTMPFVTTAADRAIFTMGSGGSGHSFEIADVTVTTTNEGGIRGWESVSALNVTSGAVTGSNPFPTVAQFAANGLFIRKTSAASSVAAANWIVLADSRTCYVFIQTNDTAGQYYSVVFGDITPVLSGDAYRSFVAGRIATGSSIVNEWAMSVNAPYLASGAVGGNKIEPLNGHYMPRSYTGGGSSIQVGKHGDVVKGGLNNNSAASPASAPIGSGTGMNYPQPTDGGLYISPIWVTEGTGASGVLRGRMRGLYQGLHPIGSFNDGDTFTGAAGSEYASRTFMIVKSIAGHSQSGYAVVEISNTWDA